MFQVQMTDNSTKRKRYGKLKTNGYAPHVLVDFPRAAASLQPVPIARSGAPLRLVGSLRVALLKFWIPRTSRSRLVLSCFSGGSRRMGDHHIGWDVP